MYVPPAHRLDDDAELRALVAGVGAAELITTAADGYPLATLLPIVWDGDRVIAHLAAANDHWRHIEDGAPALLVCRGAQAYVSPSWYAAKAEHGRVVPTWNYSAVHLRGRVRIHRDAEWLRDAVTLLTSVHEGRREAPWRVTDAPERFVAGQLRGIVGVEVAVEAVEGKAKLSQNRSEADQRGVVDGLRAAGGAEEAAVAEQMVARLDG
ncbi:FMN-binding negative transcriptional regulator [Nocardioides sp. YIM 152588]|uniref:FMN-binding negative transcriptional regulator n=1 Tax=Nocardioides sp. YIM 152588 TaxID=3158259 RepID=UPI0032E5004A